ncbi:MAG: hypothetical protein IJ751_05810 [Oscillospiraceae bacterium]|nr:hypothetical protein [Oscillospiraceae bacterium]
MGRYSRNESYRDRSYRRGGYSMADGKEEYIDRLHEMMEGAPDEKTRQEIQRMIDKMDHD